MNQTLTELEPRALLRDTDDGSILSFRHHVLASTDGGLHDVPTAAAAILQQVQDGALIVVDDPEVRPTLRTCLGCGCTDAFGCDGGCTWVGDDACSQCVASEPRSREQVEAEIGQCNKEHLARIQCELLLDIRDMLAFQAASQTAGLQALARGTRSGANHTARLFTPGGEPLL